ncbi:uncharacterized protein DUF4328 [Kribbella voronezhensis]|uniref:Uncharacterized protein DUF4328 n=1 Tax=Kribbella voronezhensis TaxID=2512212 RepID=A0A4R7TEK1_9ACTN|nr:DUF4328 domain-containing protein [Kribbella voronezhensis]TDU89838.1 uncharacterized protein DUF4328 [Kribbella voronezhensis]
MSHYQGPYDGPPASPYPGTPAGPPQYPSSEGGPAQHYGGPPGHAGPQFGGPYPGAYPIVQSGPKYRALRRTAQVSVLLMGLTSVAAVIQSVVLWRSYGGVKRFIYLLVSEDEYQRGVERIAHTGPLLDLVNYLFLGTGIAFLIWLWQARENTEILKPDFASSYQGGYNSRSGAHRHAQGWTVGGWICPIVQFWYPLQIVQDVVTASEPPSEPGAARSGQVRSLLYGWWACWTAFWVILVGGGGFAGISFIVWLVRLVDQAQAAEATDGYVDIYDMQTFMVRVALGVNIGFTVATLLLIAAAVTSSLLLFRVTSWQQSQADARIPGWQQSQADARIPATPPGLPMPSGQPEQSVPQQQPGYLPPGPPQYAPRPLPGFTTQPGPRFPSYGSKQRQSGNSEPPSQ